MLQRVVSDGVLVQPPSPWSIENPGLYQIVSVVWRSAVATNTFLVVNEVCFGALSKHFPVLKIMSLRDRSYGAIL